MLKTIAMFVGHLVAFNVSYDMGGSRERWGVSGGLGEGAKGKFSNANIFVMREPPAIPVCKPLQAYGGRVSGKNVALSVTVSEIWAKK
jgi:hypothetical protein